MSVYPSRAKRYGITPGQLYQLLLARIGCAVCGTDAVELVVDHCHTTGLVRGLLCHPCNSGIGMLGDDPGRIRAALEYLSSAIGSMDNGVVDGYQFMDSYDTQTRPEQLGLAEG